MRDSDRSFNKYYSSAFISADTFFYTFITPFSFPCNPDSDLHLINLYLYTDILNIFDSCPITAHNYGGFI